MATKAPAATGPVASDAALVEVNKLNAETLLIPIVSTSPLIVHNWSEKAKRMMLDAQQSKKKVKENRNPQADYMASMYRIASTTGDEGHGFPVTGFKKATIGSARLYDKSVSMAFLKQVMFFRGLQTKADPQQLVELHCEPPHMREDVVRISMGSTDLRYRAEYDHWTAELQVTYVTSALSRNSLLSLIDAGGMGGGIGEWRPERGGEYGTYSIDLSREIEVL